ncbi:MAG: STAS/SEC14 domain-containing protein [Polyangia bacterium]
MELWTALGKHRYRIIDEQIHLHTGGEFTPQDARGLMDLLDTLRASSPGLVLLFNTEGGLTAPAATRRVFVDRSQSKHRTIPTAVVGTGMITRTLFRLTLDAAKRVTGRDFQIEFFAGTDEALAWLRERQGMARSAGPVRAT